MSNRKTLDERIEAAKAEVAQKEARVKEFWTSNQSMYRKRGSHTDNLAFIFLKIIRNNSKLQADYTKLTENKNALRSEYGKLKNQAREYGIIKKNVDSILSPGTERTRGKDLNAEL